MSVGSFMVFDQGSKKLWAERKAINEFISKNKNYKKIYIDIRRGNRTLF